MDIEAPRLLKVHEDGTALVRLRPGRHRSITKYFVIVVPDVLSRLRRPTDFRLDEVSFSSSRTENHSTVIIVLF